ncbi:hypothetical protein RISK_002419 [Rhodopirellula islandica]|uniref:Uncharacterized protein n=1 Tax=Rhodopirellula islandica TaxID=595434 RepID=A0A0J1BGW1_RHOIS|nr:hypothetical protein RISK_002419 [Rhodopirellula islandica]
MSLQQLDRRNQFASTARQVRRGRAASEKHPEGHSSVDEKTGSRLSRSANLLQQELRLPAAARCFERRCHGAVSGGGFH